MNFTGWFIANWMAVTGLLLTIFFGLFVRAHHLTKKYNKPKISKNINKGKGNQYNAGRDITVNKKDDS